MKKDKFNTLDKARDEIQRLESKLTQARPDNAKTSAEHGPLPAVATDRISISAVAQHPAIAPAELTLPPVTEDTLETAIRAETNWKVKWALQRSLATLQTARAVAEIKARSLR